MAHDDMTPSEFPSELQKIQERLDVVEATLEDINASIQEVLDIQRSFQGFIKVLAWIEKGATFGLKAGALIAAVYAAIRYGKLPPGSGT